MKLFPNLLFRLFTAAVGVWVCVAPAAHASVDTVTTAADSGPGSLRQTMASAGPGDTIVFSPTLANQTIYLTTGGLFIGNNVTIDASALSGGMIINGSGTFGIIQTAGSIVVNLKALTLTNGFTYGMGGGLLVGGNTTLTANGCTFIGNSAVNDFGGAVYVNAATVTFNGCTFSGNFATDGGGGIYQNGVPEGGVTLNNCTFSGNSSPSGDGGAIETSSGTFFATNCAFQNNSSALGGAIQNAADTATLGNCTFSNNVANYGGGIDNVTILTLNNCAFSGNTSPGGEGGGLANGGGSASTETATLNNCTLTDNSDPGGEGGGIYNYATLALNNCTISGNAAIDGGSGGGTMNLGMMTASDCTFSDNSADGGYGGGIVNGYEMTLNNCTLAENSADDGFGGGVFTLSATNTLINCTICSNSAVAGGDGGGIYNVGSILALTNTITAGNAADNDTDISGDYSGVANFIGGNPQLAGLGNYGGPTETMPPEPGSPVIDAGADWVTNFLATGQRGYPRLVGAHVDIGAVEWEPFVVLNTNDSGNGSLREILTLSPDYVTFTNTLSGQTIHLTSGELLVTNSTTIDGSTLPGGISIDGGGVSRVFQIGDATVTLNSLTVTNGYGGAGDGGGIENGGTLTLNHCIVSGNAAPNGSGGGIDYYYHAATLIDCTVSSNSAGDGGGCYCYDGTLTLSNCIVSGNSAIDGGGVDCGATTLALNNCTFSGDFARDTGGGVDGGGLQGGTLEATNCVFTGDSASQGGAMEWGGLGTLNQCAISTNIAQNAAGILNDYGTLTLYNCTLAADTAANGGGGAISSGAFLTAYNCTFSNNTGTNAGAIANSWDMTLNNCTLLGNSATTGNGGGIYNYWILNVTNGNFYLNTAINGQGGAIYNWHTLTLTDCSLTQNSAIDGGGIADAYGGGDFSGSALIANGCTFEANNATSGGGIFNVVSMTLNNCTLSGNRCDGNNGGAICSESTDAGYGYYPTNFLINCTVYGNGNLALGGSGGGIYSDSSSTLAMTNTIAAGNGGSDIYGTYSGMANFVGGNPRLGALSTPPFGYGGPTRTMPPEFGSPVIDAGTDWVTNFLATDQRGFPRLAGAHVDIGADESQTAPANDRPVLRKPMWLPNGEAILIFTNVANADFTVLTSTNVTLPLTQWTPLGNAFEYYPGGFQFDDDTATNNARFYDVVSP